MGTRQWTNAARSKSSSRSDGPLIRITFVIPAGRSSRPKGRPELPDGHLVAGFEEYANLRLVAICQRSRPEPA